MLSAKRIMHPIRGDYLSSNYRKSALEVSRENQARVRNTRENEAKILQM